MRRYAVDGVDVILTELRRTSGDTVTARWQDCNGTAQVVEFKPAGGSGGPFEAPQCNQ